ncbi:MAG: hypothetical protein FJ138_12440, partial [Deltaproteobacteria bacterium]|nr:hypothetical protein [Deltaproteobacteria bacterium]
MSAPAAPLLPPLLARLERLAAEQLRAYNAADLDAFCACYAPDVEVLDEGGARVLVGIGAFRERYRARFEGPPFGASVVSRALALGAPGCAPGEGRCV